MANVKITELTALTNPASSDVLPIVDVGADETKKVTIADLLENAGDGSAAAPGIAFDGDSDTGIYRLGADQLAISTGGSGRLFIKADGRVQLTTAGLGINRVSQTNFDLDVAGLSILRGTTYTDTLNGIAGDTTITSPGGQSLIFKRGTAEVSRFDSSGRLLVGTSTLTNGTINLDGSFYLSDANNNVKGLSIFEESDTVASGGTSSAFFGNRHGGGLCQITIQASDYKKQATALYFAVGKGLGNSPTMTQIVGWTNGQQSITAPTINTSAGQFTITNNDASDVLIYIHYFFNAMGN